MRGGGVIQFDYSTIGEGNPNAARSIHPIGGPGIDCTGHKRVRRSVVKRLSALGSRGVALLSPWDFTSANSN
jgi:hypothetical protein